MNLLLGLAVNLALGWAIRKCLSRPKECMAQPKIFRVAVEPEGEPIEFGVEFHYEDADRKPETELFRAHRKTNAGAMLLAGSTVRVTKGGDLVGDVGGMLPWFERVLLPDDAERFRALINDPARLVESETLAEIFQWLMGELSGRPTVRS